MTLVAWWCILLHVTALHGHLYRHGKSWNGYDFHTYPHPAKRPAIPRNVMVDVINDLGLKLLAIHNEYNENNIAISPYGALSVLIALGEGLEGEAVYEIQKATHIPNDISVIRVGLRDIHRHLKSYFIPKEGFLAGLTLNHENVTLRPEYEQILRFYGYDTATFNNALYPQPVPSEKPLTTTGAITTVEPETTTEIMRTGAADISTEGFGGITISTETTTLQVPTETTMKLPETTTNIMNTEKTTTQQGTTVTLPQSTEAKILTTTDLPTTVTSTESISTNAAIVSSTPTSEIFTTTELPPTTTNTVPPTESPTTSEQPITEESTTPTTLNTRLTTQESASTTQLSIPESTSEAVPTTTISTVSDTNPLSTVETPSTSEDLTSSQLPTSTDRGNTEAKEPDTSTVDKDVGSSSPINIDTTTSVSTDSTTVSNTSPESTTDNKINDIDGADFSTTESVGFGGISKRKARSDAKTFDQTNVIRVNTKESLLDSNNDFPFKRNSRSVVDYLIARYYDDQFNFHNDPPYIPEDRPSFLVYGKYKEYDVNFMKYNTVLPFHYAAHLNALALSFPLDSTKYYLLLLLPVDEGGIDKLICDLRLNGSIKYLIENLQYRHVIATIPSFKLRGYVTLTPSFQKLGIRRVFEPRQADFAPLTNQSGIYVTNIEQSITVTIRNYVDPVAIQGHRNLHRYDPVHFKADHPFLYFVIDADIHVTLMAGKIVNPLNSRIS